MIWIFVFILLATNIYSLGIAPAKTTFDFTANTVKEGYFRIITDDAPTKVVFTKEKELDYKARQVILLADKSKISKKLTLPVLIELKKNQLEKVKSKLSAPQMRVNSCKR